jgi:copper chaperone CopZ
MRLEALEDSLPGVQRVSASYQKQTLQVDFDEQTLSEEQFLAAVEQLGYHPQQK